MYDIYLKNYYKNGVLQKSETKLYSIPLIESELDNVLTEPSVLCEVGKTGTFEFTIHPNHPYYHPIAQMRSIMRVDYDGDTIFRGRILTIDNTLTGSKKVHCEGDMAFLLDSYQMSSKKEERPSITLNAYITKVLNEHNRQMGESGETDKCIYPGYIPGSYPSSFSSDQQITNKTDKFGSNSHEQSMNALESLTKEFGGFFRTRYVASEGKTYLDWCKHWFRKDLANSQPIAITQNIIDAQSNSEVDNIFTALIPIGKKEGQDIFINGYRTDIHGDNNRILVPQITKVYTEAQLNNGYVTEALFEKAVDQYGIIYKVQNFPNADTQEKLWSYACDWIRHNYVGGITNYDLSAIDMHHVNGTVEKYLAGDCVQLVLPSDMTELDEYVSERSSTIYRTILSAKYVLHNPDKNSYTAGISSDILNQEYGVASTSKSKGGGGGAGAKGGGSGNNQKKIGGDSELTEKNLETMAWSYIVNSEYNNDLYKQLMAEDPSGEKAAAAEKASHVRLVRNIRGTEVLDDGSAEEKNFGMATTMVLDAQAGLLDIFTPVVNVLGLDAAGRKLTELKTAKSLEIDGYNRYLSFKNLPTYHDAFDPAIEVAGGFVEIAGQAVDALLDPFDVLGIRSKEKGARLSFFGGTKENNKETASTDGENGITGAMMNVLGLNGSGELDIATIIQNGTGNNGTGTQSVGKENGKWLINMNEPLSYRDDQGTVHTIPNGTIDAKDYATISSGLQSIPSFVTQIGVFKSMIAENARIINLKASQADFETLSAQVAELDRLTSGVAQIVYIRVRNIDVDGTLRLSSLSWGNNVRIGLVAYSSLGPGSYVLGAI